MTRRREHDGQASTFSASCRSALAFVPEARVAPCRQRRVRRGRRGKKAVCRMCSFNASRQPAWTTESKSASCTASTCSCAKGRCTPRRGWRARGPRARCRRRRGIIGVLCAGRGDDARTSSVDSGNTTASAARTESTTRLCRDARARPGEVVTRSPSSARISSSSAASNSLDLFKTILATTQVRSCPRTVPRA